jgi:hypothetical protein
MSNPTGVADPGQSLSENIMANVIDALKRLERIGSEHSETTRKIIEAAGELSEKIASFYPSSTPEWTVIVQEVNETASEVITYSLGPDPRKQERPLRLYNPKLGCFVDEGREAALRFAQDIANGLLGAIEADLRRRIAEDESGLEKVQSAIRGDASPRGKLTLRPIGWARQGAQMFTGPVFQYEVENMPAGTRALVTEFRGTWKIMRITGETQSQHLGDYATPQDAVDALEAEIKAR